MSILTYNFESEYLKNNQAVTVILPDKPRSQTPAQFYRNGRKYKVLWLLHGTYGDHTDWVRKTNIEMYATERNLVVVMPSALNSNYSNWPGFMMGYDMYSYLTEELMPLVYGWLPVSDKREDNFIAGMSMGGRGTIKFAVNHPEKFAAAAVLSAVPVDLDKMTPGNPNGILNSTSPRNLASFANAGGTLTGSAWMLAVLIGLHNIPEGMAVSVPLIGGGMTKIRAVLVTAASGAPTVAGAFLGYLVGDLGPLGLAFSLCFASGAMLYVVFGEIVPQAVLLYRSKLPAFSVI